MSNGKILGLDIGVASVGVGIIDAKTGNVIHANRVYFLLQMLKIMLKGEVFVVQDV